MMPSSCVRSRCHYVRFELSLSSQTSSLTRHYGEKTGSGLVKIAQGPKNDVVAAWHSLRATLTGNKST